MWGERRARACGDSRLGCPLAPSARKPPLQVFLSSPQIGLFSPKSHIRRTKYCWKPCYKLPFQIDILEIESKKRRRTPDQELRFFCWTKERSEGPMPFVGKRRCQWARTTWGQPTPAVRRPRS